MKKPRLLSYAEFEPLFSERLHNPPGDRNTRTEEAFSDEFDRAVDKVEQYCERFAETEGEEAVFRVHPYFNWSRVIGVDSESHQFLTEPFLQGLIVVLASLSESWLVILSDGPVCTAFVTRDVVSLYIPFPEEIDADIAWALP